MMKQQLSSLMDGEGDIERCEHVFLAAKSNGEVARAWREYHLIGDAMRGELWYNDASSQLDMASRVLAQLDEHQVVVPLAPVKRPSASYKVYWSVAASVAAAFFVGLFALNQSAPQQPSQLADTVANQYVLAHHNFAPSSETYYVHNVAYAGN